MPSHLPALLHADTSHTYMWVNAKGERFWVKYHFKTDQCIDFLTQEEAIWSAGGEFIRAAYTKRKDYNDFGQPGTLVRKVMDDAQRDRQVSNVVGQLKNGVSDAVLERSLEYWCNIDKAIGDRIAKGVKGG